MNKMVWFFSIVLILIMFSSFTGAQDLLSVGGKADGINPGSTLTGLRDAVIHKGFTAKFYNKSERNYETIYGSFRNAFKRQGEFVIDNATGLMWQRSTFGSFSFREAQNKIEQLNKQRYAGYSNWRIPMILELASLTQARGVVVKRLNTLFHLDPNFFDENGYYCMSSNVVSDPSLSDNTFIFTITWSGPGSISYMNVNQRYPLKAVRSIE